MGEGQVEQHPQTALVRGIEQRAQGVVATERGIDVVEVAHVVAMRGGRDEGRREVQRVDPERHEVIERGDHAAQIAAAPSLLFEAWITDEALRGRRGIDEAMPAVRAPETIEEDRVDDRVSPPRGHAPREGAWLHRERFGAAPHERSVRELEEGLDAPRAGGDRELEVDVRVERVRVVVQRVGVARIDTSHRRAHEAVAFVPTQNERVARRRDVRATQRSAHHEPSVVTHEEPRRGRRVQDRLVGPAHHEHRVLDSVDGLRAGVLGVEMPAPIVVDELVAIHPGRERELDLEGVARVRRPHERDRVGPRTHLAAELHEGGSAGRTVA